MADAYKTLYQGQLPAAAATLATVPALTSWIIKRYSVVNNDTADRTFTLYRNGTAAANLILPPNVTIPAGGMAEWDGTDALGAGDTIAGVASVAAQLTITFSGDEVT